MKQLNLFEEIEVPVGLDPDFLPKVYDGAQCHTCNQYAKIYTRRKISFTMVVGLVVLYKYWKRGLDPLPEFVKVKPIFEKSNTIGQLPKVPTGGGDFCKLRYWGLIDKLEGHREDSSPRVGVYRLTAKGIKYLCGKISVPERAAIYATQFLGLIGDDKTVFDSMKKNFDYSELMEWND